MFESALKVLPTGLLLPSLEGTFYSMPVINCSFSYWIIASFQSSLYRTSKFIISFVTFLNGICTNLEGLNFLNIVLLCYLILILEVIHIWRPLYGGRWVLRQKWDVTGRRGWGINECSNLYVFFIKENWICAMTIHHTEPNMNTLLTRNLPFVG